MIRFSTCFLALLALYSVVALPTLRLHDSAGSFELRADEVTTTSNDPTTTSTIDSVATSVPSGGPPDGIAPISLEPNFPAWDSTFKGPYDSIRGKNGATIIGPNNPNIAIDNPDLFAPPSTDSGSVPNIKWPMSLSHNRLSSGGWGRQQNEDALPVATAMAGVNMRLKPGGIRELHWHRTSESKVAPLAEGRNFVSTVGPGDLWYFPPGIPHSLQATGDDPEGSEFLLVFDSGEFSEDSTFQVTEWLSHVPAEVLAKNFQVDISEFARVPSKQLWIFGTDTLPGPDKDAPFSGGTAKIIDSSSFKSSTTIAAAEVTVEPGAMRELHWHPTEDEWTFFLEGEGRVTVFASGTNSRTFDFQGGDVGHYVENIGNTTLKFLEIFNTDKFSNVSLNQWLALTPPALVKSHLGFSDEMIAKLSKDKPRRCWPGQGKPQ